MGTASRRLEKALRRARSYEQWREIAAQIDEINGARRWREIDYSNEYDYISIRHRLDQLRAVHAQ